MTICSGSAPHSAARAYPVTTQAKPPGCVRVGVDGEQAPGLDGLGEQPARWIEALGSWRVDLDGHARVAAARCEHLARRRTGSRARGSGARPSGPCSARGRRCAGRPRRRPCAASSGAVHRQLGLTQATTTSRRSRMSSSWSREPSSRMSTSMPVSTGTAPGRRCALRRSPRWRPSRSRLAVRDRQPGRLVRERDVLAPAPVPRIAISAMGDPPSDQSECVCRSPRASGTSGSTPPVEPGHGSVSSVAVVRRPAQRLGDHGCSRVADARQGGVRAPLGAQGDPVRAGRRTCSARRKALTR